VEDFMNTGLLNPKKALDEGWLYASPNAPSINIEKQLQQSGIDLRLKMAEKVVGAGVLSENKQESQNPSLVELQLVDDFYLFKGGETYSLTFMEDVKVPENAAALVIHRSSINRFFGIITSGLYDAGFFSKGGCGAVFRPNTDVKIKVGTRVAQIIFFSAESATLYNGQYQGT